MQAEFTTWTGHLNRLGLGLTPETFEEGLWSVATRYRKVHRALMAPLEPYRRWAGTDQAWQMFPAPQRRPAVLHIDIREGNRWVPIYRARSAEYDWNASFFDQDRIRTMMFLYGWPHVRRRGLFNDLERHLGPGLAEDFPGADAARIGFYRYTTPEPREVVPGVPPNGRYETRDVLELAEFR